MPTITVKTTSIVINDYKQGNYTGLKNKLSVWQKSRHGGNYVTWKAYEEDEEQEILYIHKGIKLNTLMYYFPNHTLEYDTSGNPCKYMKLNLLAEPRNDTQRESIDYLMSVGNFKSYANETQRFLCLKPGDGKTYCAINYVTKSCRIPIIIVDNDKILNQWKESFKKFTDIQDDEMFVISGSSTIKKLMKQTNNPYKVYLASHRTLDSYCNGDWSLLNNLFQKLGIGTKILDEAHIEWRNIFYIDLYTDVKATVYLTATPARSNYAEQEVYSQLFDGIITYGLLEYRDEKYIRYIEYLWNTKPTQVQEVKMSNAHGFDSNAYNDYLLELKYDKFLKLLKSILTDMWNSMPDKKIAIVVNCNNMIEKLYEDLSSSVFINKSTKKAKKVKVGRFCGLVPKAVREEELDKQLILTTLKGFNKGVDVDGLCVVINTVSASSKVIMEQLSGRLRYSATDKKYFIQLTDTGFKQCRSHSTIRNKLMKNIAKKSYVLEDSTS